MLRGKSEGEEDPISPCKVNVLRCSNEISRLKVRYSSSVITAVAATCIYAGAPDDENLAGLTVTMRGS